MKNQLAGQIIGIPVSRQNENPSSSNTSLALTHSKVDRKKKMMNRHEKKAYNFVQGIREHGPLAGLLFISTQRVAFCSERSIKFFSPNGELVRFHYKVSIPLRKVKRVDPKIFQLSPTGTVSILNELQTKPEVIQVSPSRKRVLADLMDVLAWGKAIWKGLSHLASAGMAYKPLLTPQDKGERMPKGLHSR
ncbi:GEM-like protein 4 [Vitis vinifera]|uniref:GEM-like protein 4 n=1 Tax=Vitis vinifera TaxID=29760 RepID=A0A438BYL4_VITVI|nr:GEM-like protein 4 [Vitis vinifera]